VPLISWLAPLKWFDCWWRPDTAPLEALRASQRRHYGCYSHHWLHLAISKEVRVPLITAACPYFYQYKYIHLSSYNHEKYSSLTPSHMLLSGRGYLCLIDYAVICYIISTFAILCIWGLHFETSARQVSPTGMRDTFSARGYSWSQQFVINTMMITSTAHIWKTIFPAPKIPVPLAEIIASPSFYFSLSTHHFASLTIALLRMRRWCLTILLIIAILSYSIRYQ